ncbi:hypothetical protein [Afipia sp. 1NLS2]|uniref:hypothetical protein n=1 Tax=Afipia sp. 1NLS2 TaxID=666684 RepID=UPI0012EA1766|nr:hypothetical protein [Afipia sp. 1NLS2]
MTKTTKKTTTKVADFTPMIEIRGSLAPFELVKNRTQAGSIKAARCFCNAVLKD